MSGALAVFLVVALVTLAGLGVVALVGLARSPRDIVRHAAVAPLAGMAWTGVAASTLATAGWRLGLGSLVALAAITCAGGAERLASAPAPPAAAPSARRSSRLEKGVVAAALLTIAVVLAFALSVFRVKPLAEYDGWAMWGMKSRAIAVLGSADPDVFASPAYERLHLEYPLLLPSLHALPLQLADGFSSNTVVLSCLAVGLAGLLAGWGLLRDRVRPALLLPFVAAVAAAPAFFGQLHTGYADVPLAMFAAAGLVSAARWALDGHGAWLGLATLFLAAAALTKNEGLLLAAATYAALLVVATGRRRAAALSAIGVALAYAPWRAYTAVHDLDAPDYDLSSSFDVGWVAGRLDRAPVALEELLRRATDVAQLGVLFALAVLAIGLALAVGPRRLGVLGGGFGALSLAGLTWIYVLTPYDVSAYLGTNAFRVVVPVVICLAALAPLLVEESVRAAARGCPVGRAR